MIPESPVLDPRCRVFPDGAGMVIRLGDTALRLTDTGRSEQARAVLGLLDGRPPEAVLRGLGFPHLGDGMRILSQLTASGMLVDRGVAGFPTEAPARHNVVTSRLIEPGLEVLRSNAPDLGLFENHRGVAAEWMPVFPLDGMLIAGPVIRAGEPGCFQCFELRWIGIARSILPEDAYFRWLRDGGWREELLTLAEEPLLDALEEQAVAEWLAGRRNFILTQDRSTREIERRPFLPHSDCPVCGQGPRAFDAADWTDWRTARPGPPLRSLRDNIEAVIDDRVGLAGSIAPVDSGASGSVPLHSHAGVFALPRVAKLVSDGIRVCAGLQPDAEMARLVAATEALERYCGLFPLTPAIRAPHLDVWDRAVDPLLLPLYSERQYAEPGFPFEPFNDDQVLSWVQGYSLTRGAPKLVPMSIASYGPTDDDLADETSSGVAARTSLVEAASHGLLELIERDAFMIHWLNRLSAPLVDLGSLPAGFTRAAASEIQEAGYEAHAVNLTTDLGIPAFLAIAIHRGGKYPALLAGAGAAFDPLAALDRAFHETLSAVRFHREAGERDPGRPMDPAEVTCLDDHGKAYAHPVWLPRAEFLWASPRRQKAAELQSSVPVLANPGEQLAAAVEILRAAGHETIVVNLTAREVEPTGVRVARTIVPGLQPVGFGKHFARLGGRRLFEAPVRMGYLRQPPPESELYLVPHCFP